MDAIIGISAFVIYFVVGLVLGVTAQYFGFRHIKKIHGMKTRPWSSDLKQDCWCRHNTMRGDLIFSAAYASCFGWPILLLMGLAMLLGVANEGLYKWVERKALAGPADPPPPAAPKELTVEEEFKRRTGRELGSSEEDVA